MRRHTLPTPHATDALARALVLACPPRATIALVGDLGAGKSSFARAAIRALGVLGPIPSPTYALVASYDAGGRRVLHADWYRLGDADELEQIGWDELVADHDLVLIEWADRFPEALPTDRLDLSLRAHGAGREACWQATGAGHAALERVDVG